jgi:hypothetical protein
MKVRRNLLDDSSLTSTFDWGAIEKEFGLMEQTNYNLAYAAVDRHTTTNKDSASKDSTRRRDFKAPPEALGSGCTLTP